MRLKQYCHWLYRKVKHMTTQFFKRVINERVVDTRKYRYIYVTDIREDHAWIERLKLKYLGTTRSLESWEIVKSI